MLLRRPPDAAPTAADVVLPNEGMEDTGTVEKLLSLGVVPWLLPSAVLASCAGAVRPAAVQSSCFWCVSSSCGQSARISACCTCTGKTNEYNYFTGGHCSTNHSCCKREGSQLVGDGVQDKLRLNF
jgi:hypothetical protein